MLIEHLQKWIKPALVVSAGHYNGDDLVIHEANIRRLVYSLLGSPAGVYHTVHFVIWFKATVLSLRLRGQEDFEGVCTVDDLLSKVLLSLVKRTALEESLNRFKLIMPEVLTYPVYYNLVTAVRSLQDGLTLFKHKSGVRDIVLETLKTGVVSTSETVVLLTELHLLAQQEVQEKVRLVACDQLPEELVDLLSEYALIAEAVPTGWTATEVTYVEPILNWRQKIARKREEWRRRVAAGFGEITGLASFGI